MIYLLITGMALVTYIPRAIPAFLIERLKFGKKTEKFLSLIPYTAMVALIFPGVLTVDEKLIGIGIAGALTAGILSWIKTPLTLVILGAVAADMLIYYLN